MPITICPDLAYDGKGGTYVYTGKDTHGDITYGKIVPGKDVDYFRRYRANHDGESIYLTIEQWRVRGFQLHAERTAADTRASGPEDYAAPRTETDRLLVEATDKLARFRAQVREVAIRTAERQDWCDDGLNEVLTELGLEPVGRTRLVRVSVEVEVDREQVADEAVDGVEADMLRHLEASGWAVDSLHASLPYPEGD